jgi:hypothetical protein
MMFVFSLLILTLEQQRAVFPPWFRNNLEQYFLFVTLIAGRGKGPCQTHARALCAHQFCCFVARFSCFSCAN